MDRSQLDTLARRYLSTRFDHTEEWLAETSDEVARDVIGDELAERGDAVTAALAYGDYSSALDRARDLLPDADELTRAKARPPATGGRARGDQGGMPGTQRVNRWCSPR